jgi:hypothetical protein
MAYNLNLQSEIHLANDITNLVFMPMLEKASINYNTCILNRELLQLGRYNNIDCIDKINSLNLDIIFIVTDHAVYGDLTQFVNDFNAPTLVLSQVDKDPSYNIIFPYWFLAYPKYYDSICKIDANLTSNNYNKKYLFSCLVNNYKAFKAANLIKLHQSTFWNKTLITFQNADYHPNTQGECLDIDHYVIQGEKYYNEILRPMLPLNPLGPIILDDLLKYDNAGYLESYINIVVEHQVDFNMVTEKTTKCFLAEQIFVIFGGPGTVANLESYGFDMFTDIIDHGRYDKCSNVSERLKNLYLLLEEIKDYDWDQIYTNTIHRRTKNKNLILDGILKDQFDNIIETEIQKLLHK